MLLLLLSACGTHRPVWDTPDDHLAMATYYHLPPDCSADELEAAIKDDFASKVLEAFSQFQHQHANETWHSWSPPFNAAELEAHGRELWIGRSACDVLNGLPFVGPGQFCSCNPTNQGTGLSAGVETM